MKTLLNPYSVQLNKNPFIDVYSEPCFVFGDFRIYKYYEKHYLHTFKNIIVAERCGVNTELIMNLANDTKPENSVRLFHDYERPKSAMIEGIEYANKNRFAIN